jgi:hypothetical protein
VLHSPPRRLGQKGLRKLSLHPQWPKNLPPKFPPKSLPIPPSLMRRLQKLILQLAPLPTVFPIMETRLSPRPRHKLMRAPRTLLRKQVGKPNSRFPGNLVKTAGSRYRVIPPKPRRGSLPPPQPCRILRAGLKTFQWSHPEPISLLASLP